MGAERSWIRLSGDADWKRGRVSRDSLERSQRQARLQVASEDEGVIREFGLQYLFGVVDTAEADEAGLPGTRRSGPMTGPSGANGTRGCTFTTTTITSRRRWTISPNSTGRVTCRIGARQGLG